MGDSFVYSFLLFLYAYTVISTFSILESLLYGSSLALLLCLNPHWTFIFKSVDHLHYISFIHLLRKQKGPLYCLSYPKCFSVGILKNPPKNKQHLKNKVH